MAKKKMDAMIKKPDASLDDFNPGVHGETVTQYEKYIEINVADGIGLGSLCFML